MGVPVPAGLQLYVIWVNYGCGADIARSRASLLRQGATVPDLSLRFVCVNNGPGDGRAENLAIAGMAVLEMRENAGFGRACNRGIRWVADRDRAAAVWLLNPDTEVAAGCLAAIARTLATDGQWRTDWAICGTTVITPTGEIWQTGGDWDRRTGSILPRRDRPPDPHSNLPDSLQDTDWVSGCSLLLNLGHFGDAMPQFDPDFFLYYEDFDLCQRQRRAGHPVQWLPAATVIHHPSSITGRTPHRRLRWSLHGYWLALEKHAPRSVLITRLLRTAIAALLTAPRDRPTAIAKATAIGDYLRHRLQKIFRPFLPKKFP